MNAIVTWNANIESDLAGYYVYHGFVTNNYDPGIFVAAPTTQYLFTGLDVGITHYFNVKAADTSGNLSAFGGEVTKLEPYPVYPMALLTRRSVLHRRDYVWNTDTDDTSSGFIADVLGLNVPPIPPDPPEQFPIYEAIGGFMIV